MRINENIKFRVLAIMISEHLIFANEADLI